jgi:hypothetical protein
MEIKFLFYSFSTILLKKYVLLSCFLVFFGFSQTVLSTTIPQITLSDPDQNPYGSFGYHVETMGDNVLIGDIHDDANSDHAIGLIYLYDSSGNLLHTFTDPTPDDDYIFGYDIAASRDKILLTEVYVTSLGSRGPAHVYLYDISGNLLHEFRDPSPEYDYFGCCIQIVGDKILIGALPDQYSDKPGLIYLYDSSGNLLHTFTDPNPEDEIEFGHAFAASGNKILIDGLTDSEHSGYQKRVYLYDSSGNLLHTFTDPNPNDEYTFQWGWFEISNDKILIVAQEPNHHLALLYLYDSSGNLLHTFTDPNPDDEYDFSEVVISDDLILIEATLRYGTEKILYLYDSSGNLLHTFTDPNSNDGYVFTSSMAIVNDKIWVSSYSNYDPRLVHIFDISDILSSSKTISQNTQSVGEHSNNLIEEKQSTVVSEVPTSKILQGNNKQDQEKPLTEQLENDDSKTGGGCLIATAAYGTELAPQVQLLREIRNNVLSQTSSGVSFMSAFNSIYYSFSPTIADFERSNPIFKEAVRIAIIPLISTLSILNYADIDSEQEIFGYGIGVILLNVGIYFVVPVIVITNLKQQLRKI